MKRPLSMTGFGRGECTGAGKKWIAEVRSVNHRYLSTKIKTPRKYLALEDRIKKEIAFYHTRGHIELFLDVDEGFSEEGRLKIDLALAREYYSCLKAVQQELSLNDSPDLTILAGFRDIITLKEESVVAEEVNKIWPMVKVAIDAALNAAAEMRENEGRALKKELEERVGCFVATLTRIESGLPTVIKRKEMLFKERLDNLLQDVDIDPLRLAQETAVMVEKLDVTEELVRLQSHIKQLQSFLELDEPIGRRMDFLLQEFLREVNTMASKINDAGTAHLLVDLKNDLEKMREQSQNLE